MKRIDYAYFLTEKSREELKKGCPGEVFKQISEMECDPGIMCDACWNKEMTVEEMKYELDIKEEEIDDPAWKKNFLKRFTRKERINACAAD